MGLIEAILLGLQFERLQKPLIFITMLIGLLFFTAMGTVILFGIVASATSGKPLNLELMGVIFGLISFSGISFGLAALCGHFINTKSIKYVIYSVGIVTHLDKADV